MCQRMDITLVTSPRPTFHGWAPEFCLFASLYRRIRDRVKMKLEASPEVVKYGPLHRAIPSRRQGKAIFSLVLPLKGSSAAEMGNSYFIV